MSFDYNTSRKKLVLPEYGRNIQYMIDHAMSLDNREERIQSAQAIIDVMGNMNPHLRDIDDFKHKLWDHLAIMSEFDLDIDWPYKLPTKEILEEKPNIIPYNNYTIRFKHYGKAIELFIAKAIEIEDEEERQALIKLIANHMKKAYLTWNRESVNDEVIFSDLKHLSKGKLVAPDDLKLAEVKDIVNKTKKKKSNKRK
jgi:hypothetical protein